MILGRYAWGYLSYGGYFCGSFAQLDDNIGWVLKPNAKSCIGGGNPFGGERYFEAPVYTNRDGFRTSQPGGETSAGAVLTVGDSWTFGYGVSYEDSYPGQLDRMIEAPVVILASPAYAGAQATLLAERWSSVLKPKALVYLELGFWERGACSGRTRPWLINKPCFWSPPGQAEAELVLPPDGMVEGFSRFGVLPGGMVGAGEKTWAYFLISRPLSKAQQMLVRVGLLSGMADDFRARNVKGSAIRAALLSKLVEVSEKADVPLVLIDPYNLYADLMATFTEVDRFRGVRVDQDRWQVAVGDQMYRLPPEEAHVPHDGHFGPGANRLVAELVRDALGELGVH